MRTLFVGLFFSTAILADVQVVVSGVLNVGDTSKNPSVLAWKSPFSDRISEPLGPRNAPSQSGAKRHKSSRTDQAPPFSPCSPPDLPVGPTTFDRYL